VTLAEFDHVRDILQAFPVGHVGNIGTAREFRRVRDCSVPDCSVREFDRFR
jgi:hypothetical protein